MGASTAGEMELLCSSLSQSFPINLSDAPRSDWHGAAAVPGESQRLSDMIAFEKVSWEQQGEQRRGEQHPLHGDKDARSRPEIAAVSFAAGTGSEPCPCLGAKTGVIDVFFALPVGTLGLFRDDSHELPVQNGPMIRVPS